MKLSQILRGVSAASAGPVPPELEVQALACDSRRVGPGTLFFALSGTRQDGARFVREAVERGAVAVLGAAADAGLEAAVPFFISADPRQALAVAAANFFGRPARGLTLLGVTGTNGKTTTAYLVEAILEAAGERPGIIGTVAWRFAGSERPASHTTPDSLVLQELLAQMRDAGTTAVAMEVSSHALAQQRVHGLSFSAAGFTNLTRDHLDYHGDMESYFAAKCRLFFELCAGPAVVNADDPWGRRLLDELSREGRTAWGFSARGGQAELTVRDVAFSLSGITGTLCTPRGQAPLAAHLVGVHNLENILCAAGLGLGAGLPLEAVARGLASLAAVPGRLEPFEQGGRRVFVDYAHTDDALTRALAALRALSPGRLLCLFGCGGDRDRGKRPLMGEAAGRGADQVVVTSDNPRGEPPERILEEILPGLERAGSRRLSAGERARGERGYWVEPDRRQAIAQAVAALGPGDALLLAGKGHETYQLVGSERLAFDDRLEARRALGVQP